MVAPPSRRSGKLALVSDDQIKALMEDLDSSMANFDERLKAHKEGIQEIATTSGIGRAGDLSFPTIDLEAQGGCLPPMDVLDPAPASASFAPPTAPGAPAMDLLAELARAAEAHEQTRIIESRSQQEAEQRLNQILRTIFDYLHQFTQHLNIIKPSIPLSYVLDYRHRFGALQWSEGFVDYRTRNTSEIVLMESVSVRLRYATSALEITRPADRVHALRHELYLLNLTISDEANVDVADSGSGVRFTLAGSIPVQLNFRSDPSSGKIVVRARNVGALGLSAYLIEPDRLSRASLDAVGLNLLGRASRLPDEFIPIAFTTKE